MGIKAGLGDVAARVGQSRGFEKTVEYGKMLSTGINDSNVAINTFAATLQNSLANLSAYMDNVSTSKSYLDVVRAQGEVMLSELGEMKQLALQAQNASATDRLSLQSALSAKQATIAKKLSTAEFGGVNIFTNSTISNNFIVGNGLNISASIDASSGTALTSTSGIIATGASVVGGSTTITSTSNATTVDVTVRVYGQATLNNAAATLGASNTVTLSQGSVMVIDYYTTNGTAAQDVTRSITLVGGAAGTSCNFQVGTTPSTVVSFQGAVPVASLGASAVINSGVFSVSLGASNGGASTNMTYGSSVASVGAIGAITIGTGAITPGSACTIDTVANATIAANVIEAAADQIRQVLRKVDNAASALEGVSDTQIGVEEAMGSAVEELTSADITECMSEIVKGQSMVQYTTAVWSGQKQLSDLALRTFQQAVA